MGYTLLHGRIMLVTPTKKATKKMQSKSEKLSSNSLTSLPQEVSILGVKFRVELTKLDEGVVGDTVGLYRRIRISEDSDSKRKWTTLVHEWIHAALFINGVSSVIDENIEEIITQTLEHAIEEMLRQIGPSLMEQIKD